MQSTAPVRVGFGPANYAGQAAAFAAAVCRLRTGVAAETTMIRRAGGFAFPADVYVDHDALDDLETQIALLRRVLGNYTHVVADAFLPVFGHLNGNDIGADLPALRRAGVRVALLAHGSEVRHPVRHRERIPYSPFHDLPDDRLDRMTQRAERNQHLAASSRLPVFVTTPDLLLDLPQAAWAPAVVDVDAWRSDEPVLRRRRPVVLHAPSARWLKGTDRILPTLTGLHDEGTIELRLAENLPPDRVRQMVGGADVVLDQFGIGCYGVFAVEAMAAGRPTLAFLDEPVLDLFPEPPPIVNATPDTLRAKLLDLLADRDSAARIAAESVEYAGEFHDGRRTVQVLQTFFDRPAVD
jgi:hypothetical protein